MTKKAEQSPADILTNKVREKKIHSVSDHLISNKKHINALDSLGWAALVIAATEGDIEMVKLLLQRGANPNVTNSPNHETALINSAFNGDTAVVNELLHAGADMRIQDIKKKNAMEYACEQRHPAVVNLLIDEEIEREAAAMALLNMTKDGSFSAPGSPVLFSASYHVTFMKKNSKESLTIEGNFSGLIDTPKKSNPRKRAKE
jgi:ankyrin repeat protein